MSDSAVCILGGEGLLNENFNISRFWQLDGNVKSWNRTFLPICTAPSKGFAYNCIVLDYIVKKCGV